MPNRVMTNPAIEIGPNGNAYECFTMIPTRKVRKPTETTSGHHEGAGRWIPSPLTRGGSGSTFTPAACLRSQSASFPVTVGSTAKFHSCGGEGIDHSSVAPFHGSAG